MYSLPFRRKLILRAVTAAVLFSALVLGLSLLESVSETVFSQARKPRSSGVARPAPRFSEFPHNVQAHKKDCASCHKFPSPNWKTVRAEKDAFPDITEYPAHESCLDCHRQQFFKGAKPAICSICHVNPSPRDSRRQPFPNPREVFDPSPKGKRAVSDFEIRFPHATHIDIVSRIRSSSTIFRNASFAAGRLAEESCAVCHKTIQPQGDSSDEYLTKPPADLGDAFWLKKGTFKSVPTGHTTCFTCHSADSGMTPSPISCGTCHVLKGPQPPADFDPTLAARMGATERVMLDAWRKRDSAGAFRHEFSSHAELECSTCHSAEKINTLDPATKRVTITSCAMCHLTATADDGGALNFEVEARRKNASSQCVKCHVVFGKMPIPQSHLEAIKAAGGK
jgi:hypothetical protein